MLDSFALLLSGFATALQPTNLIFAFLGCLIGTLVGILPGIGPVAALSMLLPITFVLDPIPAIIMLAAIYYGCNYGGTITSVLVNVPGESASVVTCLDGYQMAKNGRAGAALAVAAFGSFIGGTIATVGLVLLAAPLTSMALKFGPPEFFSLMVMGLTLVTALAGRSLIRALMSASFGMAVAMVGIDPVIGVPRFIFDQPELLGGFGIVPVAMGLFGVGEILMNVESKPKELINTKLRELWMTREEAKRSFLPVLRGTAIGFFLGLIPGIGGVVPTFISYAVEKNSSKTPEKFGTGMIEGVAGPETTNNAYANASLIPLLTLGIPGSPTVAVLLGALMMNGLLPGPYLFKDHAEFVWAVIASLYIGNVILVVMNLPMIPLWVSILKIPQTILWPLILSFCVIGVFSVDNSIFDVGTMVVFAIIGYLFRKLDIPIAPMILTFILGPLMEKGLSGSMEMSQGDFSIFFTRPISVAFLALALIIVVTSTIRIVGQVRGEDSQM